MITIFQITQFLRGLTPVQFWSLYVVGIFLVTPAFGFAGAVVLKQLSNDGQSGFLYGALLGSVFPMLVLWLGTTWPWYWRLCSLIGTVVFASVAGVAFPIFIITQAMSVAVE